MQVIEALRYIHNVFEVSKDQENTGNFEGVYIEGC